MIALCDPMPPTSKRRKAPTKVNKPQNKNTSRGLVRIIAGAHRGRRLPVLVHEGLRPTADRVKETLFNWLMNDIQGAVCLDMFAGSGSLGIEALSRGAKQVVFIEQDKNVAEQINSNLRILRETDKSTVLNTSAFSCQLSTYEKFNIVFIDPPFGNNMLEKSLQILIENKLLAAHAHIYIEAGHNDSFAVPQDFVLLKELRTSQVDARLYQHQP